MFSVVSVCLLPMMPLVSHKSHWDPPPPIGSYCSLGTPAALAPPLLYDDHPQGSGPAGVLVQVERV